MSIEIREQFVEAKSCELWSVGKSTKSGANAPDDRAYLRFEIA